MNIPPLSPLKALSISIANEIAVNLNLRGIQAPGGSDNITALQELTSQFKVGWSRLSNVALVENSDTPTYRAELVNYEVSLTFKDLKIEDKAQDFLYEVLVLLSGYQPYYLFDSLTPVNCGFVSFVETTKAMKYAATFNTGFSWKRGEDINLTPIGDDNITQYELYLELWNSPTLQTNNEVLDYASR